MLNELKVFEAVGAAHHPRPAADPANVPRSLSLTDPFDMASATKAEVARALPAWHSERQRLNRERVGRRDTTDGDRLAVAVMRVAGVIFAVAVAGVAVWVAGAVAGVVGLGIALAATFGAAAWTRTLLDRSERTRREAVTQLDLAIRLLDERIGEAFRHHALIPHTRTRVSF
jgi:predicted small integral membrane protein